MYFLYHLLYIVIHVSIFIIITIKECFDNFYWYIKELYASGLLSQPEDFLIRTKSQISHFEKLPSHIGIVIHEEHVCLQQIANVIVWCLTLGIPHISIYDSNGLLKSNKLSLYKNTIKCKDKYLQKLSSRYKVSFYNLESDELKNGSRYDHTYEKEVLVSLLNFDDGKQNIVNAAQSLCKEVKENISESPIDILKFKKYLKVLPTSPDPELILCFGRGSSLVGYLPWHVHLSEMIFKSSHHSFKLSQLIDALVKYSSCQQRFGK